MKLNNLKFTTKLAISSAAFILPIGVMLFSIITGSLSSIQKDKNELHGIEMLRPAMSLIQIIPQYVRISLDNAPGDQDFIRDYSMELFNELNVKYTKYFKLQNNDNTMFTLNENFDHLINTKIRTTVLFAYREFIRDLIKLMVYVSDNLGLITDSRLENVYLISAAVNELPQAQERMVNIGNLLRSIEEGAFTQRRREELILNLELLVYSNNVSVLNRFNSIENILNDNVEILESFDYLLKTCYDRIEFFSQSVEYAINSQVIDSNSLTSLYEIFSHANNAAYRLQASSLDHLELLIKSRIRQNELHFIFLLIASFGASVLAFIFVTTTVISIRKSTDTMGVVFKHLDKNNLSVQFESFSSDEMGELMTSLAVVLKKLNMSLIKFIKNANMVSTAVVELSSSAKEIKTTANEQSVSVSEIVSTMENNKALASQAAEKTTEVAYLASHTQELSRRGAELRDTNESMMLDIQNQNSKMIEIIKNLADILSRIDESIEIIDTIADRTKLIAFNAALEASSSGEAGARFSIVAGEIRRFADNVVESVSEIKEKITELNEASQILITEANSGTTAIDLNYKRMVEQKEVFENIVDASRNVAIRSQQISDLSRQQEMASEQVFTALKEISIGVSQFVSAISATSASVEKLNNMSIELKDTLDKYHTTDKE
jgi:methyl-accepting chemotaxis protein